MRRKDLGWRLNIESLSNDFSGMTHSARAYNTRMTAHAKTLTPYETSALSLTWRRFPLSALAFRFKTILPDLAPDSSALPHLSHDSHSAKPRFEA